MADEDLRMRLELCKTYHLYLGGLTYLITRLIDRRQKGGSYANDFVENVYAVSERFAFEIEECDLDFIGYLVRSPRNASLSIEEDLIEIQNGLRSHSYADKYRF